MASARSPSDLVPSISMSRYSFGFSDARKMCVVLCVIGRPMPSIHHLEQAGRAHAAADAHRHHDVLGLAAAALDQSMAGAARAGHAEGMADRDRAAVDVELVVGNAELVAAVEHLHGEGLVQLPQVDVVHLETEALEQLGDGVDRADAHLVGLATRHYQPLVDAERREA